MTPFDSWYAAHVAPALKDAPAVAQKAARASAAEIWNAAIDAVVIADTRSGKNLNRYAGVTDESVAFLVALRKQQLQVLRADSVVTP
jgi:hypothetical protein